MEKGDIVKWYWGENGRTYIIIDIIDDEAVLRGNFGSKIIIDGLIPMSELKYL